MSDKQTVKALHSIKRHLAVEAETKRAFFIRANAFLRKVTVKVPSRNN